MAETQTDWEKVRCADLAQREERRAKKNGNGNGRHAAAQKIVVVGSEAFRAEIREELRRLQMAERAERIRGAHALRMRLRGQRCFGEFLRAAERLTAYETPSRLFDSGYLPTL